MRINTNVSALQAQQNLNTVNRSASDSMRKLSSGFRITKAGDDAAGLSIANNLRTQTRSLTVASRNIEQSNAMLSIAEGSTSSIEKLVERAKELAVQAASDNNDTQRATLDDEYQSIIAEVDRISASTEFQGTALIDGTFSNKTLQIGAGNSSNEQLGITLGNMGATSLGLTGNLTSLSGAQSALDNIDKALDTVNEQLSTIGQYQNRLDFANENVRTAIVNLSATESTIRDLDMADEMSKFSKNQILAQAGTSMLAQANAASQNVLSLLR